MVNILQIANNWRIEGILMEDNTAAIKKIPIACSFCGKDRKELDFLIEGPEINGERIYICNECIEASYEVSKSNKPLVSIQKITHPKRLNNT